MTTARMRSDRDRRSVSRTNRQLAVTVLCGGPSGEREISLQSGEAVAKALNSRGHKVVCADIGPGDLSALDREVDCVFVALHGRFGEDGQVQAAMEERGVCYAGSGPQSCALAMNKARAKAKFAELGLPTPEYKVATSDCVDQAVRGWTLPVVVKPVKEGSSLFCHIVRSADRLRPTVERVLADYPECLIEAYVPGREITVGILGSQALPPLEIRTSREFYDYKAKYVDEDTDYVFDIDLPEALLTRIGEMSLAAHRGLGCRDFSRVDWRVDDDRLEPFLLEVNVIPGLTSHSLLPKAAGQVGLSMADMCQQIIDLALARRRL